MEGFALFARLFSLLDQTTSSNKKVALLADFFDEAGDKDKVWAIALMTGKRPPRSVNTTLLRAWAAEHSGIPLWLFEESYHIVGDLAETIALLLPEPKRRSEGSLADWIDYVVSIKPLEEEGKKGALVKAWGRLDAMERFVFNKIITGGFRIGVAKKTVIKALAKQTGKDEAHIAHRLIGKWHPDDVTYQSLIHEDSILDDLSKPYPFLLAYAIDEEPEEIGPIADYQLEYKWDGIRGQMICRQGHVFIWTRGEELVSEKYPEFADLPDATNKDFVIDGEILAMKEGAPMAFQDLQKRINRKTVGKKLLKDIPIHFIAYDLMEYEGEDIREEGQAARRSKLEELISSMDHPRLGISEVLKPSSWEEAKTLREGARDLGSEGLMVKHIDGKYQDGRKRGIWWKWKVDPLTIDGVMIYAMRGHGRRSGLYTDLTFAVWDEDRLVPFTKAYSGLTDAEFKEVTSFVNKNTLERFGPVRSVTPDLVFELAFEGIGYSTRHKSGVALRFPRIVRWRKDKPASEANTLEDLKALIPYKKVSD